MATKTAPDSAPMPMPALAPGLSLRLECGLDFDVGCGRLIVDPGEAVGEEETAGEPVAV